MIKYVILGLWLYFTAAFSFSLLVFPFTLKLCTEKKKERDEETEEIVPEDPPVSVPDEEVVVHKKVKLVNELHD